MDNKKDYTMLIVDDSILSQKVLVALFSDNYNIISATNGDEALKIIEQQGQIDIVMLDLIMPVMDGFETLKRLKELPYFKDIPVLMITSNSTLDNHIKALELGANDFVVRPFIPEIVVNKVNSIMASRRRYLSLEKESHDMKNRAELDQMTGLYNQVTAKNIINKILHECKHQLHAMLLIDIDNFKAINDMSGHLIGDHVIKVVADLISGHFRKTDIVARVGGDEFLVLMTDISEIEPARQKINSLLQTMRYKPNRTIPENVSLSIGFTVVERGEDANYETVFARADEALHHAKNTGKAQLREFGMNYQNLEALNKKNILLISRNRSVCSIVCALSPKEVSVVEFIDVQDLKFLLPKDIEQTILVYVDLSDGQQENEILKSLYEFDWIKNVAVVPLCKEGNLEQYRTCLQYPVKDLLSVPIDSSSFQRRMFSHIEHILT